MKKLTLTLSAVLIVAAGSGTASYGAEADATVKIQSARVSRSLTTLQAKFGTSYYAEGSPGVSITLLLKLKNMSLLTPGRDAIAIDTFIDDTYQNLLANNQYGSGYSGQQPRVSEDGNSVIFVVNTSQSPSDEAGRVFVRGKFKARVTRGTPKVETGTLPMVVGQGARVGTFQTSLRSIAATGENSFSLNLAVFGDTSRILKVRALDSSKSRVLNDPRQTYFNHSQDGPSGFSQPNGTVNLTLREAVSNFLVIEYTVAEKVESVSVPFEAQVDLGVAKAGPVESVDPQAPAGNSGAAARPWPPPANSPSTLPARRAPFVPDPKATIKGLSPTNTSPASRF